MKKYEKYKDSGIEWLGDIPEHWEVSLLKRFCKVTDGSHYSPKSIKDGKPYVSVKDIGNNVINLESCNKISEDDFDALIKNGCSPKTDDILLTKDGTIGRAAIVTERYKPFVVLSSLGILSPKQSILPRFLYFYLISGLNIEQMYSKIHGSALTRLTIDKINNLVFTFSKSLPEQKNIADFLDRKTSEIDELVKQKENLIELYEEEKKAIINHAVTKGINPDVKLKPSSIEWLGDIPEHWEVKKLKYVANANPSNIDKKSKENETEVYLCNYVDVYKNDFIDKNLKFMKATANANQISKFQLEIKDVIVTKDSECPDDIGNPALVKEAFENLVCGYHLTHIKPAKINGEFLFRYFQTQFLKSYFEVSANGVTRYGLGVDKLNSSIIVVPPLKEQKVIVEHIEKETERIDTKINKAKKYIDLIKEYRTALINEAVTGKIRV